MGPPSAATLAGLSLPERIVAIAQSQVGYSTDPSNSYGNKFSAYWDAGTADCPGGERSESWCADFAAWVWQEAGAHFTYGDEPGDINGAAVSFYEWGVANGAWHRATSRYVASPGDVAVYGLSLGYRSSASHVAIVTADAASRPGPDVVNGDGDRTGFSVVESGTGQPYADAADGDSALDGDVTPPEPPARREDERFSGRPTNGSRLAMTVQPFLRAHVDDGVANRFAGWTTRKSLDVRYPPPLKRWLARLVHIA